MVKEWIEDPTSNYGMAFYADTGSTDTNRIFTPSENSDLEKLPRLIILYEE